MRLSGILKKRKFIFENCPSPRYQKPVNSFKKICLKSKFVKRVFESFYDISKFDERKLEFF